MIALLASLVLSQITCDAMYGCIPLTDDIAPGICLTAVDCAPSDVHPLAGSCSAGQYMTGTLTSGPTCSTPSPSGVSVTTSTRSSPAFNTTYTPSATKATLVIASVTSSCALTLTGGQNSLLQLVSDSAATPTTERARVSNSNSGTLVVGIAITNANAGVLTFIVPATEKYRLNRSTTGTQCTDTINQVVEQAL